MRSVLRLPLTLRFAMLPGLAVLLLLLLLLALAQWFLVGELARRALLRSEHRAAQMAQQLDAELMAAVREVRLLARSARLAEPGPVAGLRAELERLQEPTRPYVWVGLAGLDGTVIAGTRGWLEGQSIAGRPVFRQALQHSFVGDLHPPVALAALMAADARAPTELLDIGEPVRNAEGRIVGVLVAHLGVEWVDRLQAAATGESAGNPVPSISVHVISGATNHLVLPGRPPPHGVPMRLPRSMLVEAADGRRYFAAMQDLGQPDQAPLLPWRVLVLQERSAALAPAHRLMRSMAAVAALLALAVAAGGMLLARRMLRPWHPIFDTVLSRLPPGADADALAGGVDAIARELAPAGSGEELRGPEALLTRLAKGARSLKRAVDHLPVGLALIDRDFRVDYINPAYTRLLGWTNEQVRGRIAAEFLFDAVERAEFLGIFQQFGDTPGELASRFDALTPDGSRVAIQWHLVPLIGDDGVMEGAIALVHDIRAERAARARGDAMAGRLRALADAAVDALVATLAVDGRVLEWSRGAEVLTGHPAGHALGQPIQDLLDASARWPDWLMQARREGRAPVASELTVSDGRHRWFEGSVYALGLAPGSARFGLILRDLSEQREVHQALQVSEARLRLAVDAARMGTWEVDVDRSGQPVQWSAGYAAVFGVPRDLLPDSPEQMDALIHPDDRPAVRAALLATTRDDVPLSTEFRLLHPDGERWHALTGRALRGPDGRARRIVGVSMDITARKEAESALRAGREQLERIVQTMAEGLAMIGPDGRYTLVNPVAEQILGVPAERVVGCHYLQPPWKRLRTDGSGFPDAEHPFVRLQQEPGVIIGLPMSLQHPDGKVRTVSLNARAVQLADGGFGGLVVTYADITERWLAEKALADSQARLTAIVTSASDAIVSTDLEGRISLFNPAAERIFGLSAESLQGQSLDRLLPQGIGRRHVAHLQAFARSGVSRRAMGAGRVGGFHADGRPLDLEASISQAEVNGQTVLTAILRDVTERVAQERALENTRGELVQLARRLLEQEKQTTRRLAQALHDELGQTLSALRLHWEGLATAPESLAARQRERVGALVATANRQIRSVLGELRPPLLDEFGLAAALDNELRQQHPVSGEPVVTLEVPARLQAQRWPADVEYAAFMIAREALVNALHHAGAAHIALRVDGDAGELKLSLHDDGVGIEPEDRAGRPGHLGLVGMRERALAIGGTLVLDSGPGEGTRVTLHWMPTDEPDLPGR